MAEIVTVEFERDALEALVEMLNVSKVGQNPGEASRQFVLTYSGGSEKKAKVKLVTA